MNKTLDLLIVADKEMQILLLSMCENAIRNLQDLKILYENANINSVSINKKIDKLEQLHQQIKNNLDDGKKLELSSAYGKIKNQSSKDKKFDELIKELKEMG